MAGYCPDAGTSDWCTPEKYVKPLHLFFNGPPALDPCSNPWSKVAAKVNYILPEHDGLVDSWDFPTIYFNPPFGKGYVHKELKTFITPKQFRELLKKERDEWQLGTLFDWIYRGYKAYHDHGSQVIGLCPAYVDTKPWQACIWPTARSVLFPKGRIKFDLPPVQCMAYTIPSGRCEEQGAWYSIQGKGEDATKTISCLGHKEFIPGKPKKWSSDPAPMACALPYWGDHPKLFKEAFEHLGVVLQLR